MQHWVNGRRPEGNLCSLHRIARSDEASLGPATDGQWPAGRLSPWQLLVRVSRQTHPHANAALFFLRTHPDSASWIQT